MKFKTLIPIDKTLNVFVYCPLTTSQGASHASPLLAIMSIIQLFTFILIFAIPLSHSLPSFSPFLPFLCLKVCCSLCLKLSVLSGLPGQFISHFSPQEAFPDHSKAELPALLWTFTIGFFYYSIAPTLVIPIDYLFDSLPL